MKKLLFGLVSLVFITATVIYILNLKPQGKVSEVLSERSQEYLKKQEGDFESEWQDVELDGSDIPDTRNSVFNVDGCFSFKMLYRVFNQRIEGECEGYYAFNNPRGSIVTYLRPGGVEGVDFRRQNPDIYEESSISAAGREFMVFKKAEGTYEATAFHVLPSGSGLTFTLKVTTTQNLDGDLKEMLASVEILKN